MADDPNAETPETAGGDAPPPVQDAADASAAAAQVVHTVDTPEGEFSISFSPRAGGDGANAAPASTSASGSALRGSTSLRDGTSGSFFDQLQGIPIEYLVATPLIAAARANMALAQVMVEFINEIAFQGDGKTTNIISFDLTREVQNATSGNFNTQTITVNAPLLALVPLPALLVQSVNVDLTVEVSQAITQNSSSSATVSVSANDSWGFGSVSVTGSYTSSQSRTRATNQSAKYQINVVAQQQPAAEGMSRLMDVFASTITPIPATKQ